MTGAAAARARAAGALACALALTLTAACDTSPVLVAEETARRPPTLCPAPTPDYGLAAYPAGTDVYVDAAAPAGGDGSAAAPFRTLAEATAGTSPGATLTVHVAAGSYRENVQIAERPTDSYVFVGGYAAGGRFTARDPARTPTRIKAADPTAPVFWFRNVGLLVVDGFELSSASAGVVSSGWMSGRSATVVHCDIHDVDLGAHAFDDPEQGHGIALSVLKAVVVDNFIHGNKGGNLGAGLFLSAVQGEAGAEALVQGNVLQGNTGTGGNIHGPGAWMTMGGAFRDNLVLGNRMISSDNSAGGGGLAVWGEVTVAIERSVFIANQAMTEGGGINIEGGARATITSCLVAGNRAGRSGGGVAVEIGYTGTRGGADIVNATIADNAAGEGGGGVAASSADVTLLNSVLAGNTSPAHPDFQLYGDAVVTASYSSYRAFVAPSGATFAPGAGVVDVADPGFVDASRLDYRLAPGSLLVDVGTSNGAPSDDLDGRARPQGAAVDLGAYELGACPAIGTHAW